MSSIVRAAIERRPRHPDGAHHQAAWLPFRRRRSAAARGLRDTGSRRSGAQAGRLRSLPRRLQRAWGQGTALQVPDGNVVVAAVAEAVLARVRRRQRELGEAVSPAPQPQITTAVLRLRDAVADMQPSTRPPGRAALAPKRRLRALPPGVRRRAPALARPEPTSAASRSDGVSIAVRRFEEADAWRSGAGWVY